MTRPSEHDLIARYFAPVAGEGGLSLKDDAALISPRPGYDLVLTVDALVAGVHFFPDDPAGSIAVKSLGVNLSDLAAKGADPVGFLLALALPSNWTEEWLEAFASKLGAVARTARCPLLGGDTVRAASGLTISITAIGEVPKGQMVRRTTARPGDRICVTGTIGDAALGLALRGNPDWSSALSAEARHFLADRYLHPQPRNAVAASLRDHAHAAMDVSDGLAGDLAKLVGTAGLGAVIETDLVPLSPAARAALARDPSLLDAILTGGDDYEVLCTVAEEELALFLRSSDRAGVSVSVIGTVTEDPSPPVFRQAGGEQRYGVGSFSHF
jgi:thiamine-monophosphate kinase